LHSVNRTKYYRQSIKTAAFWKSSTVMGMAINLWCSSPVAE